MTHNTLGPLFAGPCTVPYREVKFDRNSLEIKLNIQQNIFVGLFDVK
jgi:hypothetical protein